MSEKKKGGTLFSFFNKKTKNDPSDDTIVVDKDILDDPETPDVNVIENSEKCKCFFLLLNLIIKFNLMLIAYINIYYLILIVEKKCN